MEKEINKRINNWITWNFIWLLIYGIIIFLYEATKMNALYWVAFLCLAGIIISWMKVQTWVIIAELKR